MNKTIMTGKSTYIPSMEFVHDFPKRKGSKEELELSYGTVISTDFETQTARVLTQMIQERPTDNSNVTVADLDTRNTVECMVIQKELAYKIIATPGKKEKFVGDIEMPPIGAIVVYGYIGGVLQDKFTPVIFGSIHPMAGSYHFADLEGKLKELSGEGVVKYRETVEGYFDKELDDGTRIHGFLDAITDSDNPKKIWEEETKQDGEYTRTQYDGSEQELVIINIKDGVKTTTYKGPPDTIVTEENGKITYEFVGGFKTEISATGVKTFNAGVLGVDLALHIHPTPVGPSLAPIPM